MPYVITETNPNHSIAIHEHGINEKTLKLKDYSMDLLSPPNIEKGSIETPMTPLDRFIISIEANPLAITAPAIDGLNIYESTGNIRQAISYYSLSAGQPCSIRVEDGVVTVMSGSEVAWKDVIVKQIRDGSTKANYDIKQIVFSSDGAVLV